MGHAKSCHCTTGPLEPAVDRKGRRYGFWCSLGRHVWPSLDDAQKCCDPKWRRCLSVVATPEIAPHLDAVYSRFWSEAS